MISGCGAVSAQVSVSAGFERIHDEMAIAAQARSKLRALIGLFESA